jgi:transposase
MLIESQRHAISVILTYRYRLLPTKQQHRVLEAILESQRQLYNAALEERIDAYRKANVSRTYFDQSKELTQWRHEDPEASALLVALQRATLKRLDEAYKGFFRRVKSGGKPGFPRFRGKGSFDSFGCLSIWRWFVHRGRIGRGCYLLRRDREPQVREASLERRRTRPSPRRHAHHGGRWQGDRREVGGRGRGGLSARKSTPGRSSLA